MLVCVKYLGLDSQLSLLQIVIFTFSFFMNGKKNIQLYWIRIALAVKIPQFFVMSLIPVMPSSGMAGGCIIFIIMPLCLVHSICVFLYSFNIVASQVK